MWAKDGKPRKLEFTVRTCVNNYPQCRYNFTASYTAACALRDTHCLCYERGADLTVMVHFCCVLVQFSNTVVSQRSEYGWTERLKNGRINFQHEEGTGLPSTFITDENIVLARVMILQNRRVSDYS